MNGNRLIVAPEPELVRLCVDLGATQVGGPLTDAEHGLVASVASLPSTDPALLEEVRAAIRAGGDPIGDAFAVIRTPLVRRARGAFWTPPAIVGPMLDWALAAKPRRVVDPGCGSGRFSAECVRRDPELEVVAIDLDPVGALMTRAALAALDAKHATVVCGDYLTAEIPERDGRTAWVGNPPYVRHHDLTPETKAWATAAAKRMGLKISGLAGLHALFFLATALHARAGDVGTFVTSAEWLDVGYGSIVRHLLTNGLGGRALDLVDPKAVPFEDAMTTALITCFEKAAAPSEVVLRQVKTPADLLCLAEGTATATSVLTANGRWSPLFRAVAGTKAERTLGDVARVHRGFVTGGNDYFLMTRAEAANLGLTAWCKPAITGASEILASNGEVRDTPDRRMVLDLPADIDREANPAVDSYLKQGEAQGLPARYITSHRRPWWRIGLNPPAPIVASYMARQAPKFALNPDGLALLNIGHGIYPREEMAEDELRALVDTLNAARDGYTGNGRTYHGGLEKFEPREMEALPI